MHLNLGHCTKITQ